MKLSKYLTAFFISLLFFTSCKNEDNPVDSIDITRRPGYNSLTTDDKLLIAELDKNISKIESASPVSDNMDLSSLNSFADKKIIGLGEATHGTKEFFQMKHKIFKFFVENYNYKVFGFEADMGECIYIDRLICKGTGTIEQAMDKMHFWTWKTEEVKELILWMKEYNRTKSPQDQVHFLGFDSQYWDYNSDLLKDYISNAGVSIPGYISRIFDEIKTLSSAADNTSLLSSQYDLYYSKCDSVKNYLDNNKTQLIATSGEPEFEQMKRLAIQTAQSIDVRTNRDSNKRDFYMAQNAVWMSNLFGLNSKIVIWAHNGHIKKSSDSYQFNTMGKNLTNSISSGYAAIGFSFGNGTFLAVTQSGSGSYSGLNVQSFTQVHEKLSINYIFGFAKYENFLFKSSKAASSVLLSNFLGPIRKFFTVGAVYNPQNNYYSYTSLANNFDAVIHLSNTNASVRL